MRSLKLSLQGGALLAGCSVAHACRFVRQPLSPDRTYNETIQDVQNTFRWHDRHTFRPHQHFTYDPSNWSRTLAEKTKESTKLSLVQRLSMEEEHARERIANEAFTTGLAQASLAAMGEDTSPVVIAAAGARAEEEGGGVWEKVPLQELLDEAQRLQRLLKCRRYSHNASLVIRDRQRREQREVLMHILDRLCGAKVDETITLDALIFSWFVLLDNAGELLRARSDSDGRVGGANGVLPDEDVFRGTYSALEGSLLKHFTGNKSDFFNEDVAANATLEELIEAARVLSHPFTRQGAEAYGSSDTTAALEEATIRLSAGVHQLLVERLIEPAAVGSSSQPGDAVGGEREYLDPAHTEALSLVLHAAQRAVGERVWEVAVPMLLRALKGNASYLQSLLRASIGQTSRHELRAALLHGRRPRLADKERTETGSDDEGAQRHASDSSAHPKPFVTDWTSPSRGVSTPLTEADDIRCILSAFTELLSMYAERKDPSPDSLALLVEVLDAVQALVAYTPNYDLDPVAAIRFANVAIGTGVLQALSHRDSFPRLRDVEPAVNDDTGGESVQRAMRVVLMLSRVDYPQAFAHHTEQRAIQLPLLLANLATLRPPTIAGKTKADVNTLWEWRRLRGVAVHRLLEALSVEDLIASERISGCSVAMQGAPLPPWEQSVAFGTYDGLVPLALWRATCDHRFAVTARRLNLALAGSDAVPSPTTAAAVSPRSGEALLRLRGRPYAQRRQSRQSPLDAVSLPYVALCVEAASAGQLRAGDLLKNPDLWKETTSFVSTEGQDGAGVELLLADAKSLVQKRRAATSKVSFFPSSR